MTRTRLLRLLWAAALCAAPARLPAVSPPPLRAVLPGGLRVVLAPQRSTSMIGAALLVETGPDPVPGAGLLMSRLLWPGDAARSDAALASRSAAAWQPGSLLLAGSALPEDAPRLLARFAAALRRPGLSDRAVEAARQSVLAEIRQRDLDPYRLGSETLRQALYPFSPLGRPNLEGDEASLKALTPQWLSAYSRQRFVARRMVLALSGDFDPSRADSGQYALGGYWQTWALNAVIIFAGPISFALPKGRLELARIARQAMAINAVPPKRS